ncbi:MAG: substrate-binding domain-containing protein [Verrucomicrobiota bacterium]
MLVEVVKVDFLAFLPPGLHPGMDALARGLAAGVAERGGELRLRLGEQTEAVRASVAEGVDAIFVFVTDPLVPAEAVAEARSAGVRVYTFHRPCYEVSGSVLVPNFYQGVALATCLAKKVGIGGRIAILGGPEILDDEELVSGCLDGAKRAGLEVLNDPFLREYRNLEDVKGASEQVVRRLMGDCFPFDGLVVFNDETLHDVVAILEERGLLGAFPIVSRNGSAAAIEWVRKGWTTATLDYGLPEIGRLGASLLDGEEPLVMGPAGVLYDRANVAEFVGWERRVGDFELKVVD